METLTRKFQKIWGDCCCFRQHHVEDERGGYTLLRNHNMIVPERQSTKTKQGRVAPHGCFVVCVGPERLRFAIKIEHANHPRFMALLEDAENEYGKSIHNNGGPICLPCDVDVFCEALAEIMIADFDSSASDSSTSSCRSCQRSWGSRLFKIPRVLKLNLNRGA